MKRREFVSFLAGTAITLPIATRAQQAATPAVGFLSSRSPEESAVHNEAFRRGLNGSGFVDGRNVSIAYR
jgi:putative ABC transport system substrate-binding protein